MGNHGSRKDRAKFGKQGGKAANTLSRVEKLRGPPVDSYDKLIAWLAEMAENDHVELDTSVFVSQLNRVCRKNAQINHLELTTGDDFAEFGGLIEGGNSMLNGACKRAPNTRQNSTSCDSHVSHASSELTQRNKSSIRSDDFLDPCTPWRSGVSTRQNTFSDDFEEEDADLLKASLESLYSTTDRDSELESILAYDAACRRSGRNYSFQTCSPLQKTTLAKGLRYTKNNIILKPFSASTGNLTTCRLVDSTGASCLPGVFVKKSASMLDLTSKPKPINQRDNLPKLALSREIKESRETKLSQGNAVQRKKLGSGPKSLSMTSGRQRLPKVQRQFSLHVDPRPTMHLSGKGALPPQMSFSSGGALPPIFPPHTKNLIPSDKPPKTPSFPFLNDDLLDRNIADILFSLEALWPKK